MEAGPPSNTPRLCTRKKKKICLYKCNLELQFGLEEEREVTLPRGEITSLVSLQYHVFEEF